MDHRVGLCSSCGASFKLPASFSAARAKCKACGGVVEVGPVRSDAGPSDSSAPPPPPKKKREGPSMKEQLLAKRQAAAQAESTPSAIPGRRVDRAGGTTGGGGKPAQVAPGTGARGVAAVPTGKVAPGARKPVAGAGARTSSSGAGSTSPISTGRGAKGPAVVPGAAAGRGSRRSAPASSRRRGGRDKGKDAEEGAEAGGRAGRSRPKRKQSPALLGITLLLVVVAAGAGAWFLMTSGADDAQAAQPEETATPTPSEGNGDALAAGSAADTEATDADAAEPETAPKETAASEDGGQQRAPSAPRRVDFAAIGQFGPDEGTDEAEWQRIKDLVATALDSGSGIAGSRARQELESLGRPAVPAILNAMMRLDYTTEQGYQDGDVAQRMLRVISNGKNFEWRYTTEPADVYFNERVVQLWTEVWGRAKDDMNYWLFFTGQITGEEPPADGEGADQDTIQIDDDDLDALDDLDGL